MLKSLFMKYLYVKVYENRFVLKLMEEGARSITVMAPDPFTTKRLLVGQFTAAERALRKGIKDLFAHRWFPSRPVVVIHPMERVEGGLSEIEERVLRELAAGAGAYRVVVWVGQELSDAEVRQRAESKIG